MKIKIFRVDISKGTIERFLLSIMEKESFEIEDCDYYKGKEVKELSYIDWKDIVEKLKSGELKLFGLARELNIMPSRLKNNLIKHGYGEFPLTNSRKRLTSEEKEALIEELKTDKHTDEIAAKYEMTPSYMRYLKRRL